MEWLLLLLCPLMMIFCMKGHGGKNHSHINNHKQKYQSCSSDEQQMQQMHPIDQYKINELMGKIDLLTEQNNQLKEDLQSLKNKNENNVLS